MRAVVGILVNDRRFIIILFFHFVAGVPVNATFQARTKINLERKSFVLLLTFRSS